METETTLFKVFVEETKNIITVGRNDFKPHEDNMLPGVEILLDGLSRQVSREHYENAKIEAIL